MSAPFGRQLGGKLLASSISERTVLTGGGVLFCIFSVLAFFGMGRKETGRLPTASTCFNLLKLPKAHKWVCFEFFYSNIDNVLFCSSLAFV